MKQRVFLSLLVSVTILGMASCASSAGPGTSADRFFTINGHVMHLSVEGSGATVILSAGSGVKDPTADFQKVTAVISQEARTVVFDRAGFGKSAATTAERDLDTVTSEMHDLFAAAGLAAPYILVGHSIASLDVLGFAQAYPSLVAGIVLIEGTPPSIMPQAMTDAMLAKAKSDVAWGFMPKASYDEALWWRPNAALIEKRGTLGGIPLVYIHRTGVGDVDWLHAYSDVVSVVEVIGKDHYIHKSNPDTVIGEIEKLLAHGAS
jgi:pimeloyl-ACP methyl ester carboxylesterase